MQTERDATELEKERQREMSKQFQEKIQEMLRQTATDPSAQITIAQLQQELNVTRGQVQTEQENARSAGKAHYERITELEQRNKIAASQSAHIKYDEQCRRKAD